MQLFMGLTRLLYLQILMEYYGIFVGKGGLELSHSNGYLIRWGKTQNHKT